MDPLADLKATGERLRAARERQAAALASHAWAMWRALRAGQASRNKIVAASALTHQAAWDVIALADEASPAYDALAAAGVPTDRDTVNTSGAEVSLRPLSSRRVLVALDAVPADGEPDAATIWRAAMSALRDAGWAPQEVEQPDDPGAGYWPKATIQRRGSGSRG